MNDNELTRLTNEVTGKIEALREGVTLDLPEYRLMITRSPQHYILFTSGELHYTSSLAGTRKLVRKEIRETLRRQELFERKVRNDETGPAES